MEEHIQNIVELLKESIENEDWSLVSESINQLENIELPEFDDDLPF